MTVRTLLPIVAAVAVVAALLAPVRAQQGGLVQIWDVYDTGQAGQLTIYNADDNGTLYGEPVSSGDVDGDGFDDVVTCAFYGPSGPSNGRRAAGKIHLWFGAADVLRGGVIYDAGAPMAPTVEIWGARPDDFLGSDVDVADVTGDGFADILAGAENADGFDTDSSRTQAGMLYVVEGGASISTSGPIDLAHPPSNVVEILGAHAGDRFGFWVTAGDVTGDGINDLVVSADLAKGSNGVGNARGAVYIIPGRPDFPPRIDLGDPAMVRALGVTTIYGVDDGDHFGSSMVTGDFDGDGLVDVAIGAGLSRAGAAFTGYGQLNNAIGQGGGDGPNNDRNDAGEAYVLFGRTSWPATIEMRSPPSDATILYGDESNSYFGEEVRAGDVDGDGKDELAVGALTASPLGRAGAGIGYVFWSRGFGRGKRIDARTAGPDVMTAIYGEAAGDIGADSMVLADVDRDGLADVLFGSPTNSPTPLHRGGALQRAGDLKVIFGRPERLPGVVDTAHPPVAIYQLIPADSGDMFTYSIAVGDVDGDGQLDLIPNSMGGDGFQNRHEAAGDAAVISGKVFSERAGRGVDTPTCLSRVTASPSQRKYYAGQTGIELSLFCDEGTFQPGAVAIIRGVAVPTELVSASELHVRLDDAPDVRNASGQLTVQVQNPGAGLSAAVLSITLAGPTIKSAKIVAMGDAYVIKIKGRTFLDGATASVTTEAGEEVPTLSVDRKSAKAMRVRIARAAVASGATLTVRVLNPGPAPSNPATVVVP